MTTATLNIAKNLTVVVGNVVYMTKLGNVVKEANKYDVINLNGIIKTSKLNRYLTALTSNGYSVTSENWNRVNEFAEGVTDLSIELRKA